jgi:hypothetical protein
MVVFCFVLFGYVHVIDNYNFEAGCQRRSEKAGTGFAYPTLKSPATRPSQSRCLALRRQLSNLGYHRHKAPSSHSVQEENSANRARLCNQGLKPPDPTISVHCSPSRGAPSDDEAHGILPCLCSVGVGKPV